MSETETAQQPRMRSSFASRLLTKELNVRMKTTQEMKISPNDAAKYASTNTTSETKEPVAVS